MTGPFAQAVNDYYQAGWRCILPVPPETKTPPPEGFTGAEGIDVVDVAQLNEWAANGLGASSIALRLPDGVVGIDVDHDAAAAFDCSGLIKNQPDLQSLTAVHSSIPRSLPGH